MKKFVLVALAVGMTFFILTKIVEAHRVMISELEPLQAQFESEAHRIQAERGSLAEDYDGALDVVIADRNQVLRSNRFTHLGQWQVRGGFTETDRIFYLHLPWTVLLIGLWALVWLVFNFLGQLGNIRSTTEHFVEIAS